MKNRNLFTPLESQLLDALGKALSLLKDMDPWDHRNAAENLYCKFCGDRMNDRYADQEEHFPSCEYVQRMRELGLLG